MKSKATKKVKKKRTRVVSLDDGPPERTLVKQTVSPKKRYFVYLPESDTEFIKSHLNGSTLSGVFSLMVKALAKDVRRRIMPTNEFYILQATVHKMVEFLSSK